MSGNKRGNQEAKIPNQKQNVFKQKRTIAIPFLDYENMNKDGDPMELGEFQFSATRGQVNNTQIRIGNQKREDDKLTEIHNTLLDWVEEDKALQLAELFSDEDNFTLQMEVWSEVIDEFTKNRNGLGKPRVIR